MRAPGEGKPSGKAEAELAPTVIGSEEVFTVWFSNDVNRNVARGWSLARPVGEAGLCFQTNQRRRPVASRNRVGGAIPAVDGRLGGRIPRRAFGGRVFVVLFRLIG